VVLGSADMATGGGVLACAVGLGGELGVLVPWQRRIRV
jgi:hypothetical protein